MEGDKLPAGWALARLDDTLDRIVGGGTPPKSVPEYFQGNIPLMTVKDMKVTRPSETGFNITEEALQGSSAKIVPADTVIIATRMGLGKVVRPKMDTAINQDLKALFPSEALEKSFLEWWLHSVARKIEAMGTGTTVKGVRLNEVKALEIPLATLPEQQRIVEKIETLFAELDKGEEALRDVTKKVTQFYLAYRRIKNFACVEVRPTLNQLKMFLKLDPDTVDLKEGFSRDVRKIGHFGTGDLELTIGSHDDLERAKPLILRSYEES